MWKLFDSGKKNVKINMELDADLLDRLNPQDSAILHLYDWESPSFTHGYFVNPKDFLNLEEVKKEGMSWAKRPTGGGIVLHVSDLAFSVLVPSMHSGFSDNTLVNYHYVNEKVIQAVKGVIEEHKLTLLPKESEPFDQSCPYFCMAKPTIYDVMLDGKKVAGAAQRKRKQGFLHQGTISIALPSDRLLEKILTPGTQVLEAMKAHTYSLLGNTWSQSELEEIREGLKKHLKRIFLED